MATTAEYLTQLQTDKTTLVTNLVAKGVDATNDETFTTLVPKVADISTGGGKYAPRYITFQDFFGTDLSYELENLDTSKFTSFSNMFKNIRNIKSLNLKGFAKSNIKVLSINGWAILDDKLDCINLSFISGAEISLILPRSFTLKCLCGNVLIELFNILYQI